MQNNFLMGVKFWTSWGSPIFFLLGGGWVRMSENGRRVTDPKPAIDLLPPCSLNYKRNPLSNTAGARLARVWVYKGNPFKIFPSASIFQRNPFKNFFHFIFFPGKSLVKNSKLTFNFTWKSPIKNVLHFLQGNLL